MLKTDFELDTEMHWLICHHENIGGTSENGKGVITAMTQRPRDRVYVFCSCGHTAILDDDKSIKGPELRRRLRCSMCGARNPEIRLVWGGYGDEGPPND